MFKFISCINLSWLSHFWIKIISRLAIPICLSGCITIMFYCPIEGSFKASRQEVVKFIGGSYNLWDGLPNSGIDFIGCEVKSNFGINVFEFGINGISELFRGNKIIFYGIDNNTNKGYKEETNSPMRPYWEGKK